MNQIDLVFSLIAILFGYALFLTLRHLGRITSKRALKELGNDN